MQNLKSLFITIFMCSFVNANAQHATDNNQNLALIQDSVVVINARNEAYGNNQNITVAKESIISENALIEAARIKKEERMRRFYAHFSITVGSIIGLWYGSKKGRSLGYEDFNLAGTACLYSGIGALVTLGGVELLKTITKKRIKK